MNDLKTIYFQKPSLTSLLTWQELNQRLDDYQIVTQLDEEEVLYIMVMNRKEILTFIHFRGPIHFDYEEPFQKLTLSEPILRKLQFKRRSPYLFKEEQFIKAFYSLNESTLFEMEDEENYSISNLPLDKLEKYQIEDVDEKNTYLLAKSNNDEFIITKIDSKHEEASIELLFHPNEHLLNKLILHLSKEVLLLTIQFHDENLISFLTKCGFQAFTKWFVLTPFPRLVIASSKDLEKKRIEIQKTNIKPKLLLHSCCGPCSSAVIEDLSKDFDITIYYYNPNIYPPEEYELRLNEQKKIISCLKPDLDLISPPYQEDEYFQAIKGLEKMEEGSKRCFVCYQLRMEQAAKYAKDHHFDFFTTTLSISPYKNSDKINEIGQKLAKQFDIPFLYSNFKLHGGYQKSIALSKQYQLYRQEYCGCVFSKTDFEKKHKGRY